jgi:phosphotransferase family enzyme
MDVDALLAPKARIRSLPHRARPRLYFSGSTPLRRWHESALYPAFKRSARLYRFFLRCKAALAFGAAEVNPSHSWAVRDFVGDSIPDLRSSVILVGTPGPAQKMTVQLWDENGVAGYLKYGEKPAARRRLENERHVLAALPDFLGPTVMRYGTMADGVALLLSPIGGRALVPKLPPEKALKDFLQPASASGLVAIENHPWIETIRTCYGGCMDRCLDDLMGRKWPITLQHGDAAPWNIIRTSKDKLRAIDWEYGSVKGLPYLDLAYYILQIALLISRWSPRDARNYAVTCLCRNSLPALRRAEGNALVRLAAFHSYMQSREDGHPDEAFYQTWRRAVWGHNA